MKNEQWQDQLSAGLNTLNIKANQAQQTALLDYLALLEKWNKKTNLTAIRDPHIMVSRQLLDSLSVLPFITQQKICDVGTGAGLPAIPLAIMNPDKQFYLIDSNNKKTRFIQQAIFNLKLTHVNVFHARVEAVELQVDTVISRAFASLPDITEKCQHLLNKEGVFLAMKGKIPNNEIKRLEQQGWQIKSEELNVPNERSERHLIILKKCRK